MRPLVLQMFSPMPAIQERLDRSFRTKKFSEVDADWLREHGAEVRAVVTAGDIGIASALVEQLPALGIVAINGVGYDRVDLDHARHRGIRVTNTPDVLTDDVADVAIGLMINVFRRLVAADVYLRQGHWARGPFPLARKVSGRRYGILGLGRIGQAIATRLAGFGGHIAYSSRTQKPVTYDYFPDARALAAASDVLFVAVAATPATQQVIDRAVLEALGADGILVNVSRGTVIDEPALVQALAAGGIAGAGLDVFADEPNVPGALLSFDHVVLTPHLGSATHETRRVMGNLMIDNLEAFFAGTPLPTAVL